MKPESDFQKVVNRSRDNPFFEGPDEDDQDYDSGSADGDEGDDEEGAQDPREKKSLKRRFLCFSVKLGLAGFVFLCLVTCYYYMQVTSSRLDSAQKWETPAVVYSRPLELTLDQNLTFDQILNELSLLKYRKTDNPKNPGEFSYNKAKTKLVVVRRPFDFPDGFEEKRPLFIEFERGHISAIRDAATGEDLVYVRMDPVLLDRISPNGEEDRLVISIREVPEKLIKTLIQVEDRDFYNHHGVNPWAIMRAMLANLKAGRAVQGGSTLTQQLVKNYFLSREKSFDRKVRELFMSLAVDARYDKNTILEMYLNEIYLGHGDTDIYGFGLASYFYFGIPVSELSWDQAALLVGMVKGPSLYDPRRHPENALNRRNLVLRLMRDKGELSEEEYQLYSNKPLGVIDRKALRVMKVPGYMSFVKNELYDRLGRDWLDHKNLEIFTSLDPQAQQAADGAVRKVIPELIRRTGKKDLETAMVVSNWRVGEIMALVASRDPSYPGMNRVTSAKRQIGSLVKPAAYLTAFEHGWHLGSAVHDAELTVKLESGQEWKPRNFDHKFKGWIPLYQGFAESRNIPMVRVGMNAGIPNVVRTLNLLGVKEEIEPVPSVLLGSVAMTPFEVNQMYTTLASEGLYRPLSAVRYVRSGGTEVIYDRHAAMDSRQVLDPPSVYLAIYGMTIVTKQGTAKSVGSKYPGMVLAGKTGTSNGSRDSWFSGFDNNTLVTAWVGNDDNTPSGLTGATGALRLYDDFLTRFRPVSLELAQPDKIVFVNFNQDGYIMGDDCTDVRHYVRLPARSDTIRSDQFISCGGDGGDFGDAGLDSLY